MTATHIQEREQLHDAESRSPHLSFSSIHKYLTCPEQYRLYYIEKLRAKVESANLVFGAIVHLALAEFFRQGTDPAGTFGKEWAALEAIELRYSRKESWESLSVKGEGLLGKFLREETVKIQKVISVEQIFELGLTNLGLPFIGFIDLVAEMTGKRTLVEFKTAAADYEDYEVALLDQLTAYQLAEPEIEQIAVCVLTKTKKPQIKWHITERTPEHVMEFVEKAGIVCEQIAQGNFYRRTGKWCRQCEFLPICIGNIKEAQQTLVKIG